MLDQLCDFSTAPSSTTPTIWLYYFLGDGYNEATATFLGQLEAGEALAPETVDCTTDDPDEIVVSWPPAPLATGYRVFKDGTEMLWTECPDSTTSIADTDVAPNEMHTYWVQTVFNSSLSTKRMGQGWRRAAAPPEYDSLSMDGTGIEDTSAYLYVGVQNPDNLPLTFTWTFPAGAIHEASPIMGRSPVVTLDQPGTYEGTLVVSNSAGEFTKFFTFDVVAGISPPTAVIGGTSRPRTLRPTTFDASASSPQLGHSIVKYIWDFNGDSIADEELTVPQVTHIFPTGTATSLHLKVVDERGLVSAWATKSLVIAYYHETEPNDDMYSGITLTEEASEYWGSIGTRPADYPGYDGEYIDYWTIPAQAGSIKVTLETPGIQVSGLRMELWAEGVVYITTVQAGSGQGIATGIVPTGGPIDVGVVGGEGFQGGDYTLKWELE